MVSKRVVSKNIFVCQQERKDFIVIILKINLQRALKDTRQRGFDHRDRRSLIGVEFDGFECSLSMKQKLMPKNKSVMYMNEESVRL